MPQSRKDRKAKDYEVADWLVMADKVRDEAPEICDPNADYFRDAYLPGKTKGVHYPGRTLRYVGDKVIEALARIVPTVHVRYQAGPPGRARTTRVFPNNFIVHLLDALDLPLGKYSMAWKEPAIARCLFDRTNWRFIN